MRPSPAADVWPLIGRAEELILIDECFGDPGVSAGIAIVGRAGVGKSRLAAEAAAIASGAGAVVRSIVATHSARTLPLGAFWEWATGVTGNPLQLVGSVIHALTDAPEHRPVVVAVDDAQLLDELSAFVVHQLVLRRAASVILSVRTGEPVPDAVAALWKDRHVQLLELQPVSHAESDTLLRRGLKGPVDPDCAQRMWSLTRGNVLFLRHLVDQELREGRLKSSGGQWGWHGRPVVSPSLTDLIEAQVGSVPDEVLDVVDLVAISEPLDIGVLTGLTVAGAVDEAVQRGLITAKRMRTGAVARIGHPLYGEVRRSQARPLRLRRLRGRLATALSGVADPEINDALRVGVLWAESDLSPDPQLLLRAAETAFMRLDLLLAERLADASIRAGGGPDPTILRAHVLTHLNRADEGEELLASLDTDSLDDIQLSSMLIHHAANLMWPLARPTDAWKLIDATLPESNPIVRESLQAFRGLQLAMAARPAEAITTAFALDRERLPDLPALTAAWGLAIALGDVGRTGEAVTVAIEGFDRANRSRDAAYQVLSLTDFHLTALLLAGRIDDAVRAADDMYRNWADAPGLTATAANGYAAMTALRRGRLDLAHRQLTPAMAVFVAFGDVSALCDRFTIVHVELLARMGDIPAATEALPNLERRRHPGLEWLESDRLLAAAWVAAVQGAVSPAIATARRAVDYAHDHGQLVREVMCLQTATQFGDKHTAPRLTELKGLVEGPRASAAAAFAAGLAAADGAALQEASEQFEAMGDMLAAADASARAAVAYRADNLRGAGLSAAGRAQRIAQEFGGAVSPALREAAQPLRMTPREREIISLVARGYSNREIAENLTMSIRTVEGHLYRASARFGTTSRAELGAIFNAGRDQCRRDASG
jgi:DNA-binding CsgD family transcriptional regulator